MSPDVKSFLETAGLSFRVHGHPPRISFRDHGGDADFDPAASVKSLAFRLPDGRYVIVGMRGQVRADYKRIADALGLRRSELRAASADELAADLDMQPGGVTPLPRGVVVLLDSDIPELDTVYCGSGRNDATIEISGRDLGRIAGVRVCPVSRRV